MWEQAHETDRHHRRRRECHCRRRAILARWMKCVCDSSAKKGALTAQLKALGTLPAEERPAAGAAINDAKQKVQGWLDVRESALRNEQLNAALENENGRRHVAGTPPVIRWIASGEPGARADGADLRDRRLRDRRWSGDRRRLSQLRGAQHSRAPSGARDARHVLSEQRTRVAYAHVAGASARDGERRSRRFASSCPAASIGATTTQRTARCSISSKGW